MLKNALEKSFIYKIYFPFLNSYKHSGTKRFIGSVADCWQQSAVGRGLNRFSHKTPTYENSLYQKAVDKISDGINAVTVPLHDFYAKQIDGSFVYNKFFGLIKGEPSNKNPIIVVENSFIVRVVTDLLK